MVAAASAVKADELDKLARDIAIAQAAGAADTDIEALHARFRELQASTAGNTTCRTVSSGAASAASATWKRRGLHAYRSVEQGRVLHEVTLGTVAFGAW